MRSGTSFFNGHLYRNNLVRFWPIWSLYALIWAFLIPMQFFVLLTRGYDSVRLAENLAELAGDLHAFLAPGVVLSFGFGVAAAMAVFSYLYSSRSACMVHALPMDRTTLFFTNYLSGLSFLLLPNLGIFLATLALEACYGCVELGTLTTWLLAQSGTALFFYSFAVFCAMFTGHLLALPLFYGILNFLVLGISALLDAVLTLLLYGMDYQFAEMGSGWCTPLIKLYESCGRYYEEVLDIQGVTYQLAEGIQDPAAVGIYAAGGVVLAVISLLVYRVRHVESAGDVVAIPLVRPLFKYGVAVCVGLCVGTVTAALLSLESRVWSLCVCVLLWAVIGYFAAEMLLRKSFRVFGRWKGAVVLCAALAALFAAVDQDWFGYENRVPDPAQVASVTVDGPNGAPYDSAGYNGGVALTQPQQIQEVVALHQAIVTQRPDETEGGNDYIHLKVEYTLKDGGSFRRSYYSLPVDEADMDTPGTVSHAAQALLDDRDYVRILYSLDSHENDRLIEAYLDNVWNEKEQGWYDQTYLDGTAGEDLEDLWQAVLRDFDEGTIGVRYLIDNDPERLENTFRADLCFRWEKPASQGVEDERAFTAGEELTTITLTPNARHTLAWLEDVAGLRLDSQGNVTPVET